MFTCYISNQFTSVNGEKHKVTVDFIHGVKLSVAPNSCTMNRQELIKA